MIFASSRTRVIGSMVFLKMSMHKSSNFALVILVKKSFPSNRDSISIAAVVELLRLLLALSHADLSLHMALWLVLISRLNLFLNSFTKNCFNLKSMSSPPRCEFPAVAFTSKIVLSNCSTEQSKVPPPKSNTKTVSLFLL